MCLMECNQEYSKIGDVLYGADNKNIYRLSEDEYHLSSWCRSHNVKVRSQHDFDITLAISLTLHRIRVILHPHPLNISSVLLSNICLQ